MKYIVPVLVLLTLAVVSCFVGASEGKIVIAHRGASGYLPEHTLEGAAMAYALGADYLEMDIVLTKDGVPVVLHDLTLEATTNVAEIFPGRSRSDGRWYAVDFTLEEIKRLKANERVRPETRNQVYGSRFPVGWSRFHVPTMEEMIQLVQGLNKTTGRNVGVYVEIKEPVFHEREGHDIARSVMATLEKYGYTGPGAKAYVQCFDSQCLKRIKLELKSTIPLIQLISPLPKDDWMTTRAGLSEISGYAAGIGPPVSRMTNIFGGSSEGMRLVRDAREAGLVVHVYTLRKDSLPIYATDFESELRRYYFILGADGVFTDHPDYALSVARGAGP